MRQIELEPDNANAHHNLAVSYFHAKRYQEARKYCEKARQLGANVDWLAAKLTDVEEQERPGSNGDDDMQDNINDMNDEGAMDDTDEDELSDAEDHDEGEDSGEGSAAVEEPRE